MKLGKPFPYTHNLAKLLRLLGEAGIEVPAEVQRAADLTRFAYEARYPGVGPDVSIELHRECLKMAEVTVEWAGAMIHSMSGGPFNHGPAGSASAR